MAGGIRPHRRQFVLAARPHLAAPDWTSRALPCGLVLSRCPELRTAEARDAEGGLWLLLGRAVATDPGRPDPPGDIEGAAPGAIPALTHAWLGRWLLLGPRAILPDAGALLGCLYGRADDGTPVATSSPALGRVVGRAEPRAVGDPRRLAYERGVTWFPPPRTRFEGLSRLLPSQALDLASGEPVPHPAPPVLDARADPGALVERLAGAFSTALGRLGREGGPLWLGLTAGADSRAILALGVRGGAPLRPHTRLTPRMSVADRVLPPRIAAAAGLGHEFHRDRRLASPRDAIWEAHAAGSVARGDALPLLAGTRDALDGILVGGYGFGLAAGFGRWRRLPAALPEPAEGARAIASLMGEPRGSPAEAGLAEWLAWVRRTPVEGRDWRDRMLVEQRHAGWYASKEQVYDMQDVERVPLLNGVAIHEAVLSLPEDRRMGGRLQAALVALAAPELARFPVNPPDARFLASRPGAVLRRRAHRLAGRVRHRIAALAPGG